MLVSQKIVFIKNEAALQSVTMPESERAFGTTVKCITF